MIAIISDIHGNLEALHSVLVDIATYQVDAIYSLGDFVGYGVDAIACIEKAMDWFVVLQGDFDAMALESSLTLPVYENMLSRFRQQVDDHPRGKQIIDFLETRPRKMLTDEALFVHNTPAGEMRDYIFPEDIYNQNKMDRLADGFDKICFCGASHLPGLFLDEEDGWMFRSPGEFDHQYSCAPGEKLICTVGSVGQPRDSNPDACYVLFDGTKIQFRRVDYDIETAAQKIYASDEDDMHGDRLREGR